MTVELISFTETGGRLAAALAAGLERSGHRAACTRKGERAEEWTAAAFRRAEALIFVGAAGIAVRSVAPHLVSKARDPAVVVVDELGRFAVPILSGHCSVYGNVSGGVRLIGGTVIISGEGIYNDTPDILVINGQSRSVNRDSSRDVLGSQKPTPQRAQKRTKGVER